jgi:peptidoglycan/xylan/chitin deacetylase (PgdA/CDA1 family)
LLRDTAKNLIPRTLLVRKLSRQAGNCVLLTFDDGPCPGVTEAVLERLAACRARAVFFVVGRHAAAHPSLLKLVHDRGHIIGNHSYDHPIPPPRGLAAYRRQILRCQEIVLRHTGQRPRLFRAPTGKITLAGLVAPRLLGMQTVLWSLDAGDWQCRSATEARRIAAQVLSKVTGGDILLLHDFHPHILAILDVILPGLRERGFDLQGGLPSLLPA